MTQIDATVGHVVPDSEGFVRGLPDAIAERPSVALHEIASTGPFPGTGAS